MPAAANTTIKKMDGVTDIVWTALQGASAGDPVMYRQDTGQPADLPLGLRPLFRGWQKTDGKNGRTINIRYEHPYAVLNSATGRWERVRVVPATFSVTLPEDVPAAVCGEAVYQFVHLLNNSSASVPGKVSISTGFLPT